MRAGCSLDARFCRPPHDRPRQHRSSWLQRGGAPGPHPRRQTLAVIAWLGVCRHTSLRTSWSPGRLIGASHPMHIRMLSATSQVWLTRLALCQGDLHRVAADTRQRSLPPYLPHHWQRGSDRAAGGQLEDVRGELQLSTAHALHTTFVCFRNAASIRDNAIMRGPAGTALARSPRRAPHADPSPTRLHDRPSHPTCCHTCRTDFPRQALPGETWELAHRPRCTGGGSCGPEARSQCHS